MIRNLTCIVCPRGCDLTVTLEDGKVISVEGNACRRGLTYAENECTHPMRTVTSTMALENGGVVAVKTDRVIPKELVFECMKEINAHKAPAGTKIGDVLIEGVVGTDACVVATQNA